MNGSIQYHSFGSLLKKIIDNRGRTCPTAKDGLPLIATNCIKNDQLYPVFENIRYVDKETYQNWFRGHPEPGDMIFVLKGTPGRVAWVPDPVNFCIAQDMVAIRADKKKIYPKYLFAVLRSPQIQQEIEGLHVGTLIPHFKKGDFDDLQIPCVKENIQKYIGNIYFLISQKINLLHRQNVTLEATAEALFRQWFVVEAKEEWEDGVISDLFILQRGFDLPATQRNMGNVPVIAASGYNGVHSQSQVKAPGVATGRSGVIGTVFYIQEDFWPLNTTLWIKEFKNATPLYAFHVLKNLDLVNMNAGSAVPTLNRNHVHLIYQKIPPAIIIKKFEEIAVKLYKKIHTNQTQIHTLEKLRDMLLPKLMNGEVRVSY